MATTTTTRTVCDGCGLEQPDDGRNWRHVDSRLIYYRERSDYCPTCWNKKAPWAEHTVALGQVDTLQKSLDTAVEAHVEATRKHNEERTRLKAEVEAREKDVRDLLELHGSQLDELRRALHTRDIARNEHRSRTLAIIEELTRMMGTKRADRNSNRLGELTAEVWTW